MESSELKDANAQAFLSRVALEVLADCEARGVSVTADVMRECFFAAIKAWLESDQAKAIIAPIIDRAYQAWRCASQERAN